MTDVARTSYDDVPYESHPYEMTHPDWLATVGALFGMDPPRVDSCRVLELGCASGGNIVPMAAALPGSTFLGLDLSGVQIARGKEVVAQIGLTNIELRQASILDVDDDYGRFDYIICYGVFSWVPRPVQDKILSICNGNLADNGIAYVNYNAQPGGYMMAMLREMMLFDSRRSSEPGDRVRHARALLDLLAKWMPDHTTHRPFLKEMAQKLKALPDSYIFHEFLEQVNEQFYFLDFIERAEAAGSQFLGEAHVAGMFAHQAAPPDVQAALADAAPTLKLREQYIDFFRNTTFRQTLVCHAGIPLFHNLQAKTLMAFCFAGQFAPATEPAPLLAEEAVTFRGRAGAEVKTSHPILKAALLCLDEAWPRVVPYGTLLAMARERARAQTSDRDDVALADMLWYCFTHNLLHMRRTPDRFRVEPSERPRASALARAQARAKCDVTSLRHLTVRLQEHTSRVLAELDGTADRAALVTRLHAADHERVEVEARVDAALRQLGSLALLLD
jgi:2-polyprenyl-3-methyl-5-hydroxy-6-metoxy-1,4-benzoquinol methylase/methyltransferase-like protein